MDDAKHRLPVCITALPYPVEKETWHLRLLQHNRVNKATRPTTTWEFERKLNVKLEGLLNRNEQHR